MKDLGKVYILGDSYSTFENCIPQGYDSWYFSVCEEKTDVNKKEQTWWYQLLENTNSVLLLNDSFSGTTVCNTTYGGAFCPDTSFLGRMDKRLKDNFFEDNAPDTFFVFGGTNDSWSDAPIGKIKYGEWNDEELKCVLPAFCCLLDKIKKNLEKSRIVVIINTELKEEIENGFIAACDYFGVQYIKLKKISKTSGHPNKKGMREIFEQVIDKL